MKYRKIPVIIDAIQFTGDNIKEVEAFVPESEGCLSTWGDFLLFNEHGEVTASPGDWIIRGVQGEFYPCNDVVFKQTYEPVS